MNQVWSTEYQNHGLSKNVWLQQKFMSGRTRESRVVKVLRPSLARNTVNGLCIESYLDKGLSLTELPLTSSSIFGHILRSHFIIHQCLILLNTIEKSNV